MIFLPSRGQLAVWMYREISELPAFLEQIRVCHPYISNQYTENHVSVLSSKTRKSVGMAMLTEQ